MTPQRTVLRAYDLATWGRCSSVEEIKHKLAQEGLWPELIDDTLAKELEALTRLRAHTEPTQLSAKKKKGAHRQGPAAHAAR